MSLKEIMILLISLFGILLAILAMGETGITLESGEWTTIAQDSAYLFIYFGAMIILVYAIANGPSWVSLFGCGMMGLLTAGIIKALYDRGIMIDELATGTITINDAMTLPIILWIIVGIIITVLRKR